MDRPVSSPSPPAPSAAPPRRPLPRRLRYWVCGLTAAIWVLLDQGTKVIAVETLSGRGVVSSPLPYLEWVLLRNENAAFGIPGFTGMFVLVTVGVLVLVARALPRTDRLSLAFAYGLVCGGALGNAGDRLFRPPGFPDGAVVDFINIGWWPTFNLADVGIVTGAALIVLLLLRVDREARHREARAAAHTSVRPATLGPEGNGQGAVVWSAPTAADAPTGTRDAGEADAEEPPPDPPEPAVADGRQQRQAEPADAETDGRQQRLTQQDR